MSKVFGWLLSNPYVAIGLLLLGAAFIGGVVAYCEHRADVADENLRDNGRQEVIINAQQENINVLQNALRPVGPDELERVRGKYDRSRGAGQ